MAFKSIIGAVCACPTVISFNASATMATDRTLKFTNGTIGK